MNREKSNPLYQRCYKIPKKSLDLFLVKLMDSNNSLSYYQADYIFDSSKKFYDVVVSEYGCHYPWVVNNIEKFIKELK